MAGSTLASPTGDVLPLSGGRARYVSPATETWRRFRRHRLAVAGLAVLLLMMLAVALGPFVWRAPINDIDFAAQLSGPSWTHPFGTDDLGQDVLARMLYGGRISLAVGLAAMAVAVVVGTIIGAMAGMSRGSVDLVLMWLTDLFLSLPALPLLLLIIYLFRDPLKAVVGPQLGVFILIVAVIGGLRWMQVARLVRAQFHHCGRRSSSRRRARSARRGGGRWSATSCPIRSGRSSLPGRSMSPPRSSRSRRYRFSALAFRLISRPGGASCTMPRTISISRRIGH